MLCYLISLDPWENFVQNWGQSSQTLLLPYQLSFWNVLNPSLSCQLSSWRGHQEYVPSQETIVSPFRFHHGLLPIGPIFRLHSYSSSTVLCSPTAMTSSLEALNPQFVRNTVSVKHTIQLGLPNHPVSASQTCKCRSSQAFALDSSKNIVPSRKNKHYR